MINFTGEFDCKVDAKGRILLPVTFRRQMGEVEVYRFVIKQDPYVQCLEMFTIEEWEKMNKKIQKNTKTFDLVHRQVVREFRRGATEVESDPTGRILIPGRLLKQVGITNDAVLSGYFGKIEIWSPDTFYGSGDDEKERQERFQRIIGDIINNDDE